MSVKVTWHIHGCRQERAACWLNEIRQNPGPSPYSCRGVCWWVKRMKAATGRSSMWRVTRQGLPVRWVLVACPPPPLQVTARKGGAADGWRLGGKQYFYPFPYMLGRDCDGFLFYALLHRQRGAGKKKTHGLLFFLFKSQQMWATVLLRAQIKAHSHYNGCFSALTPHIGKQPQTFIESL